MKHNKKQTDMLVSQAVKLIDLIDYQEESVVSRTIVNKNTGTVTLFAFGEGQGLSLWGHFVVRFLKRFQIILA